MGRPVCLSLIGVLFLIAPLGAQETRHERIDVGGHSLHFRIDEPPNGSPDIPTIVLEAGGGNDSRFWSELQPQLAKQLQARVISYDRSGLGDSDLARRPYDIGAEADDLRTGLTQLGVTRNILLVGHSYGGMIAQVFTARWQEAVVGIVFLDPNTVSSYQDTFYRGLLEMELPAPVTKADSARVAVSRAIAETMMIVYREAPVPRDLPVVVISADSSPFSGQPIEESNIWIRSHQLLASSSDEGEWLLAEGASHSILPTHSDLVIASIRKLLRRP